MSTEFPGLDGLKQVIAKASTGPYRVEVGTITDSKDEIVAEFCAPEDARAIEALLSIKHELMGILDVMEKVKAAWADDMEMIGVVMLLKGKLVRWVSPSKQPEQ